MGLFSGIKDTWDDFRGKTGERAARQAGRVQSEAYDQVGQTYQPLIDFGMQAMPDLQSGATAGGMGSEIGNILQGQGFGQLVQERQRAADAQMSRAGLRRSGSAITAAAGIPTELAFQLEQELNRRRQSNMGIGMQGLQGQNAATLGGAGADASGILGAAQARSQGVGNIMGLISTAAQAAMGGMGGVPGMPGMGVGSPGTNAADYTGPQMANWLSRQ